MNKQQVLKKLQVLNERLDYDGSLMRVLSDVNNYKKDGLDLTKSEKSNYEIDMILINKRIEQICRQHEDFKKNMENLINN